MDVWVIFASHSWVDVDWHTEWNIHSIYDSEAKAKNALTSLEAEEKELCCFLFDEYEKISYRMEKHSVL